MKKRQKNKFTQFRIIIGVLLFVFVSYAVMNKSINPISQNPSQNRTKIFKSSSVMKFSLVLPNNYNATEKFGSVIVKAPNGTIYIGINGTNFSNLKDYIKNSKNNLESRILDRSDSNISNLEITSGMLGEEKIYFIYSSNRVYFISTKDKSLYSNLDQIAQSFRYTP